MSRLHKISRTYVKAKTRTIVELRYCTKLFATIRLLAFVLKAIHYHRHLPATGLNFTMANKDMFLWWGSGSGPCWRVMLVLAEKGLWEGCPNKLVSFAAKEHKAEDIMKLNPRGQVSSQFGSKYRTL